MQKSPISARERSCLLRFAASFLWADLDVDGSERAFFVDLARELGADEPAEEATLHLAAPPNPRDVDPSAVAPALAETVRTIALRAIAADGRVTEPEMEMFFLLDDLLPKDHQPS